MDTNNWRPSVGGDWRHLMDTNYRRPSVPNGGDWRTQLAPDLRQKIVDQIMETLKKHLPFCGPDETKELRRIAASFEEKTFNGADNQTVYLQKISMKMLACETKYQNAAGSSSSVIAANTGHLMANNNNWRPSLPNGKATMDTCDWRTQLLPDSRQNIINELMETLKKHLPFCGPDETKELRRIAASFEEKTFNGADNQTVYLQKISMKMLACETKYQNAAGSSSSVIAATNGTSMYMQRGR